MGNSMKRAMLKRQYERFCEAWTNEKRFQKYIELTGEQLPENVQKLGRKPTFSMWLRAVKNKQVSAQGTPPVATPEKKVEVEETDWET